MKQFIVGFIDWSNHELILERIEALFWQEAVIKHSKYPYAPTMQRDLITPNQLASEYPEVSIEEGFRQTCFDCDCMMNWIEI